MEMIIEKSKFPHVCTIAEYLSKYHESQYDENLKMKGIMILINYHNL